MDYSLPCAGTLPLMRDCMLDILGVSECRWTGSGRIKIGDGVEIVYSGMPEGGRMFMELHSCYQKTPQNPFSKLGW